MNLTKEKLKSLWENRQNKYNTTNKYYQRAIDIIKALKTDNIDKTPSQEHTKGFFGPAEDGITKDSKSGGAKKSIEEMKKRFNKEYDSQIDAVCTIIGAPDRKDNFRVFSNASENSNWETHTLKAGINTADNYFISNNYFYNIAKFITQSKNKDKFEDIVGKTEDKKVPLVAKWKKDHKQKDIDNQANILKKKFVTKYLWMLGNKENVVTIFSLKSFYNLQQSGIFNEYDFKCNADGDFDDFTAEWKKFSKSLFKYLAISEENDKLEFSKCLFAISLSDIDIKNVADLLQTGNKAVILWGPPGTGKTFESMEIVKELLEIDDLEGYLFSENEKSLSENDKGFYEIVQFHPNYTYQDFIGGISPKIETSSISYELRQGIFKRFCDAAKDNKDKKFIFIIDEINRAELSAVFGELLFALEYRNKPVNLPYFGEFTIPDNVYIIGTMNNVDKSLVTFDLALRRRFGFVKLMPKLDVIEDVLIETVEEISLKQYRLKCEKLNESIKEELDLGEDYQIGQAYFLKIKDFLAKTNKKKKQNITSFEREKLWVYNIEPLLEEYLGMSMEDDSIQKKLENLKNEFLKD